MVKKVIIVFLIVVLAGFSCVGFYRLAGKQNQTAVFGESLTDLHTTALITEAQFFKLAYKPSDESKKQLKTMLDIYTKKVKLLSEYTQSANTVKNALGSYKRTTDSLLKKYTLLTNQMQLSSFDEDTVQAIYKDCGDLNRLYTQAMDEIAQVQNRKDRINALVSAVLIIGTWCLGLLVTHILTLQNTERKKGAQSGQQPATVRLHLGPATQAALSQLNGTAEKYKSEKPLSQGTGASVMGISGSTVLNISTATASEVNKSTPPNTTDSDAVLSATDGGFAFTQVEAASRNNITAEDTAETADRQNTGTTEKSSAETTFGQSSNSTVQSADETAVRPTDAEVLSTSSGTKAEPTALTPHATTSDNYDKPAVQQKEIGAVTPAFDNNEIIRLRSENVRISEQLEILQASYDELTGTNTELRASLEQLENTKTRQITETEEVLEKQTTQAADLLTSLEQSKRALGATQERISYTEKNITAINDVAFMIDNIAEQIKMLSMNAAIEAAHAGESGKGFGVVAEEMSRLAAATAENSQNISATVKELIKDITFIAESGGNLEAAFEKLNLTTVGVHNFLVAIKDKLQS